MVSTQQNLKAAVILAAGVGTRLRPLTNLIPKPLLPIGNQVALLHLVRKLERLRCSDLYLNTFHLAEQIEEFLRLFKIKAVVRRESLLRDTGGGVENFRQQLSGRQFLIHNCDVYSEQDLSDLVAAHKTSGNLATLMVVDAPEINTLDVQKGEIRSFNSPVGNATFSGISVFEPEIWNFFPVREKFSLVEVFELARQSQVRIGVYRSTAYWNDFGTPKRYWDLHQHLAQVRPTNVHPGANVQSTVLTGFNFIGEGADLRNSALENCIVLPGTILDGEQHRNAVVGQTLRLQIGDE